LSNALVSEAGVCVESLLSEQRLPRTQRPAVSAPSNQKSQPIRVKNTLCLGVFVAKKSVPLLLKYDAGFTKSHGNDLWTMTKISDKACFKR
jgi:hypothetical protein